MLNVDIVTPVNNIIICKERQSLIITLAFNENVIMKGKKERESASEIHRSSFLFECICHLGFFSLFSPLKKKYKKP